MCTTFFLALNANVGAWIHTLERRDMMLLGSLTENIFGFAGSYARKQQARLAPILTGWKRWLEFNTTNTDTRLPTKWLMNLGSLHQHSGKSSNMECRSTRLPEG